MKRDAKRFGAVILVFLVVFLLVDYLSGFVLDKMFFNLPVCNNECSKISNRYRGEYDVILIGSSRCDHHFVSNLIADSIRYCCGEELTVYNMGLNGMFLNSSLCAIESIVNRYEPKMIVVESESRAFYDDLYATKGVTSAKPLYKKDPVVRDYINRLGWGYNIIMGLNLCRYGSAMPIRIIKTKMMKDDGMMGYNPIYRTMDVRDDSMLDVHDVKDWNNPKLSQYTLSNFRRVAALCHEKQIILVVVSTPLYKSSFDTNLIAQLCEKEDVNYVDMHNMELFNSHPEWFGDIEHLNDDGAHVFSAMFFGEIKKILNKK